MRPPQVHFSWGALAAMSLLKQLPRSRPYTWQQYIRKQYPTFDGQRRKGTWAKKIIDPKLEAAQWEQRAHKIKNGLDKSILVTLEERGFVKDVAGYVI